MTFDLEVGGRTQRVSVDRVPDRPHVFAVTHDGRSRLVDAVRVGAETWSLILIDNGQESHEIGFVEGADAGQVSVYLDGVTVEVTLNGRRRHRASAVAAASGEHRVVAPMPGKVLRVLATPGDDIAARQPLVVVEAMKMENELSSPRPGRVKSIAVTAGQSVEAGRLLVVVE